MEELCNRRCASLLLMFTFLTTVGSGSQVVGGPEHKLYMDLFSDYTPESRPVKNASHAVTVTFALSLNQLLDLDEKNQVLTTSLWIYEEWTDELLMWSPDRYDGQKAIMIPADSIWLPDIFIFNTAGANMDGFVNVNGSKVAIQNDGNVRWMVPLMVASVCAVDVTYFPYDRQTCTIKFGSWIYDIQQLDILSESTRPDLEHYVMNSEYDLRNVSMSRGVLDSSCCPGEGRHSMVELKIELQRKSLYYDYIVIAPTIMLCVLTLASFLLPCDRGEKMAIGLTVFLTLYVLQLRIADNVPDTNSTPILGVFMLIVMTFNCVSLIMATIVMNIKKRGDDSPCPDVPSWLFGLCHQVFGRVVCTRYLWKDQIHFPLPSEKVPYKQECDVASRKAGRSKAVPNSEKNHNPQHRSQEPRGTAPSDMGDIKMSGNKSQRHEEKSKMGERNTKEGHRTSHSAAAETTASGPKAKHGMDTLTVPPECQPYDPHKTPRPQSEGDTEMRLRKSKCSSASTDKGVRQDQQRQSTQTIGRDSVMNLAADVKKGYLMKRRWFYVAEVVDKFLFLVYLVLLTSSIFTVLFLIPVYFRSDS